MAIDVLAAIDGVLKIEEVVTSDDYCGSENCAKCRSEAKRFHALREARAAVAELIEADKEYDEAHAEFYAVAMDRETANERYMRQGRYITAGKRRAAALARVGEGA